MVARCTCSSRSALSRSASSGESKLDSEWVCPSFSRAHPASKSSTGNPHSVASVLIRFRAIPVILFDLWVSIQSAFNCLGDHEPLGTIDLAPERAKFLHL